MNAWLPLRTVMFIIIAMSCRSGQDTEDIGWKICPGPVGQQATSIGGLDPEEGAAGPDDDDETDLWQALVDYFVGGRFIGKFPCTMIFVSVVRFTLIWNHVRWIWHLLLWLLWDGWQTGSFVPVISIEHLEHLCNDFPWHVRNIWSILVMPAKSNPNNDSHVMSCDVISCHIMSYHIMYDMNMNIHQLLRSIVKPSSKLSQGHHFPRFTVSRCDEFGSPKMALDGTKKEHDAIPVYNGKFT